MAYKTIFQVNILFGKKKKICPDVDEISVLQVVHNFYLKQQIVTTILFPNWWMYLLVNIVRFLFYWFS